MTRHPSAITRISVISAALAGCFSAFAQSQPTVVVSATRFAEPIDQLPIGIRVISAADIGSSGATSVSDLLARQGGLHTRNSAGDGNVQLDLRGFGATGDQNTLVLLDGQRLSENEQTSARLSSISLDAVERIEILPGSGAVLFGSGATAGTINIITKTSGAKPGLTGKVGLGIGSFSTKRGNASLDYGNGSLGLNLAISDSSSDNDRRNNALDEQIFSGKLSTQFAGGEAWLKFAAGKTKAGLPGPLSNLQIASDPRQTTNPLDKMTADNSTGGIGGRFTMGSNEFALDITTREREFDSLAPSFAGGATNATRVDANGINPRLRVPYQLMGRPAVLVVGAEWTDWDYQRNLNLPLFFYSSDITAGQKDKALFLQNRVAISATTHAMIGVRRQTTDIEMQERAFPTPKQQRSDKLNAFELGLRHAWNADWSSSLRWGQSFRIANVDDNGFTASGSLLKPQTSHDFELATEHRFGASHLRVAAFESRVVNEIHFLATPSVGFFNGANDNLPPTQHRGVEAEYKRSLTPSLALTANYRFTHAQYREGVFGGFNVAGKDMPLVPRQRAALGAVWKGNAGLMVNANLRYVGSQRFDNDQVNVNPKMRSYTLTDVRVSQRIKDFTVALSVDNLFDEEYISYGLISAPGATGFNGYPEAGRRLTASAEWSF
jgi:iron complex outermembrane recepter protein